MRVLKAGSSGPDVTALQTACNARAERRGLAKMHADGTVGPITLRLVDAVGRALGVAEATLAQATISVGLQRVIRWPWRRTPAQLLRAKRRAKAGGAQREKAWRAMQQLIDAGVSEHGGNNRGRDVEMIIRSNGGVPGEPWCGDTVAYCYLQAGCKTVVRGWASVRMLERLLTRTRHPRLGHVVTYRFDHTGLFKCWAPERGPGFFWAGEGNTGDSGAQSDSVTGGDGVKLKLRHARDAVGFWRVRG